MNFTLLFITDCELLKDWERRLIIGKTHISIKTAQKKATMMSPFKVLFDLIFIIHSLPNTAFTHFFRERISSDKEYYAHYRLEQPYRRSQGKLE